MIDTENATPVSWSRPIRSREQQRKLEELVNDLEGKGIVEPSESMWLNPVVLVEKKTGGMRFCIDLRRLNALVKLDEYNLPNIQNLLATLGNKR